MQDALLDQSSSNAGISSKALDSSIEEPTSHAVSSTREEDKINVENNINNSINENSNISVNPSSNLHNSPGSSVLGPSGSVAGTMVAACGNSNFGMIPTNLNNIGPIPVDMANYSTNLSTSLWSSSMDDSLIHSGMSTVNSHLAYTNIRPPTANPINSQLINSNIVSQMGMNPGMPQNISPRTNMQPGGPNFPLQNRPQNLNVAHSHGHQGAFVPTNKYSWSTGVSGVANQVNAWSSAGCLSPQATGGVGIPIPSINSMGAVPSWSRGRGMGSVSPLGMAGGNPNIRPTHKVPSASSILMNKYRKSANYQAKQFSQQPTFEISGSHDGAVLPREMLQYSQDCRTNGVGNGPTGALENMQGLETCINDIMRNEQDGIKGFMNAGNSTLQALAQLHGKGHGFLGLEDSGVIINEEGHLVDALGTPLPLMSPSRSSPRSQGSENGERFSRKVFVGGLPPDIDEDEITTSFRRFGPLVVDWPHKAESKSYFPPKGYAFLLFQDECSVQQLIDACIQDEDKLYLCVSSPTIKDKPVQIRPWKLSDADFVLDATLPLDPRKTVFVGGVPRPLKAVELAMIMDRLYGGVCYAGIDTDPELKYPKGAGRVAFSNQQSYIAAISARFVQLQHGDIDKRVEVKPYVLDDQMCDECQGSRCGGKFAPFFCANVMCLQYYCEHCWQTIHSRPGRELHKPLVKEGADRPRSVSFRWC